MEASCWAQALFRLRDGAQAVAVGLALGEALEEALGHEPASPTMPTLIGLGEADARGVHVHLDDPALLRPVVDAVARERREGVEARAQREDHVGLAISSMAALEPL
jgi:hypothetical protein